MNTTALADRSQTRLTNPQPQNIDNSTWQILCEVCFPTVDNPRSIALAVSYCRARKLDILKKPVNIVPMWNSALKKEVDTIWPSINETQITAARSREWAGMNPPIFGDNKERKFTGRRKDKNGGWSDAQVTLCIPEWCEITVYRVVGGKACPFTERVYWLEAYGRSGGSDLPNAMWQKRPIGMLTKVTKAAALRAAFPEEAPSYTDDEMAGQTLDEVTASAPEQKTPPTIAPVPDVPPSAGDPMTLPMPENNNWQAFGQMLMEVIRGCSDISQVDKWRDLNKDALAEMDKAKPDMHTRLMHAINKHKLTLMPDDAEA
jgi:phage recombination protein Bet